MTVASKQNWGTLRHCTNISRHCTNILGFWFLFHMIWWLHRIHYIHKFTVKALLIVVFLSELATLKSIHYMFQCKNKTYRVYIDCSWSHGLSEYRILKFPENWVNLQSAKEELLYWWSPQIWYCLSFILQPCWIKDIYMILKYHYCFLPSPSHPHLSCTSNVRDLLTIDVLKK